MYLKVPLNYDNCFLFACLLLTAVFLSGCASSNQGNSQNNSSAAGDSPYFRTLQNGFSVDPQKASPSYIRSINLYRSGSRSSAPIIKLKSGETVTLEFDYLNTDARQFVVQISHRTPEWEESILSRNFYQSGLYEDQISASSTIRSQDPYYQHYSYTFPNEDMQLKVSGNYLMEIMSHETGEVLFSLPFFVYEDEGELRTSIQPIPAPKQSIRQYHQLFGNYLFPDFVNMPQFDLSFYFVQNQFWGRYKKAGVVQSIQDKVDFHVRRENAFIADYGFKHLDLTRLSADGVNIRAYEPSYDPPRIILRRDIQDLTPSVDPGRTTRHGFPSLDDQAQYVEVFFYLETAIDIMPGDKIYVTGDFNNWTINEENRMEYRSEKDAWEGNALIKQGTYSYKYVVVRNGVIKDMLLDNSFSLARQLYYGMIYYEDPDMGYHRLLQLNSATSK